MLSGGFFTLTLFTAGFDANEAASGEEAVALARVVQYDVVLLDLHVNRAKPASKPAANCEGSFPAWQF